MSDRAAVQQVREKVERYFTELTGTGFDTTPGGSISARHGSTRLFMACAPLGAGLTAVHLSAPVVLAVAPGPELYRFLALTSGRYPFGRLLMRQSDTHQSLVDVFYQHSLLGDYLDREEFNLAVSIVAQAADELDNEMQSLFGGRRMHEDGA